MFVLTTVRVSNLSSVAVFEDAIRLKSNYTIKSWLKTMKTRKYGNLKFLHQSASNIWFNNEIHSLLRRADTRGSWHHLPWRISLLCGSGIVNDVT